MNREQWLHEMAERLRPHFEDKGVWPYPDKMAISCGWPSTGALASGRRKIGECWAPTASKDGTHNLFISPCLDDVVEVGHVLVHEIVHSVVGTEHGHKAPFKRAAIAVGLEGKMTATTPGEALESHLRELAAKIGPYPHKALDKEASGKKKQTTRLIKLECTCDFSVRTTRKWLDEMAEAGVDLTCPLCAGTMVEA